MKFSEYQIKAKETAVYPEGFSVIYPTLGLTGESGEVSEKVKKVIRDNNGQFTLEKIQEIGKELGDVCWYLAAIANDLGINLDEVLEANLEKLASRKERNVLQGSGDNR